MSSQAQTQEKSQSQTAQQTGNLLKDVDVFIFDVFGTVVDWRTSVVKELEALGKKHGVDPATVEWAKFAQEWRSAYMHTILVSAQQGSASVPPSVDIMHRQILDGLVKKPEWVQYTSSWTEEDKVEVNLAWHRLSGWPDVVHGLAELKKDKIVVCLSNGNMSLLIDMARHANLPWSALFSTELFDTYKPNAKAYLETIRHLSVPPTRCAMVAAHIWDVRAAGKLGLKTIYIPRPDEDAEVPTGQVVKTKAEGGEVDFVVESFDDIVKLVREN